MKKSLIASVLRTALLLCGCASAAAGGNMKDAASDYSVPLQAKQ